MAKKRHSIGLEDLQSVITHCGGTTDSTLDNLLGIEEVAKLLNVKPATVWCWVCAKKPRITHFRVDSLVRFPKPWLCGWAKEQEGALKKWNFEL